MLLAMVAALAILGDGWELMAMSGQTKSVAVSDSRLVARPDLPHLAQATHFKASESGRRQLFK